MSDLRSLPSRPVDARRVAARLVAGAALAGLAATAPAQSLAPLFETARGNDAALQGNAAQMAAARHVADANRAGMRPQVGATVGASYSFGQTSRPVDSGTRSTIASAGVSARQVLFDRSLEKSIEQAERRVDVAEAALVGSEQDLVVRVAQAYFDVLAARDALETVRAQKRAISEQLASAKRNFEVGTATVTDTREAQARFDLASAQELAADNDLNTRRTVLEQVVGRKPVQPAPLRQPVTLPPLMTPSVDEWVATAEGANPQLKQLRLALDVARLDTEKAKAAKSPTVGVSGSVGSNFGRGWNWADGTSYNPLTGEPIATHSSTAGSSRGLNATVGVEATIPLFTSGLHDAQIKQALALEDKARADFEVARRTVVQNATTAYFGLQSLRAQVAALEAAESSSKLALEATQLGYKVGVRVNLDVLNATSQLYQTRRDLAKARYDVIVNSLKLKQAAGVLTTQDLMPIEAILER